jgi:hypothetical protein
MTGRDLVSASARKIGVLASGETLDATDAVDALSELNRMLASWSTKKLAIYQIKEESPLTLTPGTASYTLGSGGSITTRPMSLESALIRSGSTDYPPLSLLTLDEFAAIGNKTVQGIPYSLYDDGGYPSRTIKLYPVPSAADSLILFTKRPLTLVATLDTVLSFPEGYEDALVYNLAVRLAPEYGKALDPLVVKMASDTLNDIKRANSRQAPLLRVDGALQSVGGQFDIVTGDYRRS